MTLSITSGLWGSRGVQPANKQDAREGRPVYLTGIPMRWRVASWRRSVKRFVGYLACPTEDKHRQRRRSPPLSTCPRRPGDGGKRCRLAETPVKGARHRRWKLPPCPGWQFGRGVWRCWFAVLSGIGPGEPNRKSWQGRKQETALLSNRSGAVPH